MNPLFCAFMGLMFLPFSSDATTVKSFAFNGLCESARTIAHVRCLDRQSQPIPGRDGIFTQYRFGVIEVVKGSAEEEIVMVLPGGELAGRHTEVPGMPQFVPGQETVLFLSQKDAFGSPWPIGLGQGCYFVSVGEEGIRKVMFDQYNTIDPATRSKPSMPTKIALPSFLSTIREILKIESTPESQVR
jgi:hypothetical protein